ncbi:hypothetical protein [Flavobacterium cheongpyeongense]|nr:hypothetical protein [Flavobacterium cheongpyeongense]
MKKKSTLKKILETIWITAGILFTVWLFYSYNAKNVDETYFQNIVVR